MRVGEMCSTLFSCSCTGQPVRTLGSDVVSHRRSDSNPDRRAGSQDAVLQRSHVEALHRSVDQKRMKVMT